MDVENRVGDHTIPHLSLSPTHAISYPNNTVYKRRSKEDVEKRIVGKCVERLARSPDTCIYWGDFSDGVLLSLFSMPRSNSSNATTRTQHNQQIFPHGEKYLYFRSPSRQRAGTIQPQPHLNNRTRPSDKSSRGTTFSVPCSTK